MKSIIINMPIMPILRKDIFHLLLHLFKFLHSYILVLPQIFKKLFRFLKLSLVWCLAHSRKFFLYSLIYSEFFIIFTFWVVTFVRSAIYSEHTPGLCRKLWGSWIFLVEIATFLRLTFFHLLELVLEEEFIIFLFLFVIISIPVLFHFIDVVLHSFEPWIMTNSIIYYTPITLR